MHAKAGESDRAIRVKMVSCRSLCPRRLTNVCDRVSLSICTRVRGRLGRRAGDECCVFVGLIFPTSRLLCYLRLYVNVCPYLYCTLIYEERAALATFQSSALVVQVDKPSACTTGRCRAVVVRG
jgi:hypothetical protein